MRIAVIGAGIVGLTSAIAVKNAFPYYQVDVFADEFSPDTTGDGSAGLWGPYILGDTPSENILRWAGRTHDWLSEFWKSGLAAETGVTLVPMYRVTSNPGGWSTRPVWTRMVHGAHKMTSRQLDRLNREHKSNYQEGWHFVTYTGEPVRLLPYLTQKLLAAGGELRRRKIRELHELIDEGYDLIINCSGLGARELVGDDTVTPVRGQVTRVKAQWAMEVFVVEDDDGNYIIPNIDSTVLGGTHQENDFDRTVREVDSKFIHEGCYKMMPSLKKSEKIHEWVGLRPGRPEVRLEREILRSPRGKEYTVIHNYGHGGSGVTLSWGCALDVVDIVRNTKVQPKSNL